MQTTNDLLKVITEQNGEITSAMICDIRDSWYSYRGKKYSDLYNRYIGKSPIFSRTLSNEHKVNNKIGADFVGDIVDTKTGYMFGVPIGIECEDEISNSFLQKWLNYNSFDDKISDIGKFATIGGYAWAYLYNATDGLRMAHVKNPWEVVPIRDESTGEQIGALWFYRVDHFSTSGNVTYTYYCEWYNERTVEKWRSVDNTTWIKESEESHLLSRCPLVFFENNLEILGDCEKVQSLIDGYDKAQSDASSEIEQLRLAYGFIKGMGLNLDQDLIDSMKQTGFIPLGENGEIGFISKTIDITAVKTLLDEFRRNIYAFARSVDWSEAITGDTRVLGWQVKLMPLESKCKIMERKFTAALNELFTIACNYWKTFNGISIDPLSIKYTFRRNIPKDIEGEARTLSMLKGNTSLKTALKQMTFIDDVQEEIKMIEEEQAAYIDLESVPDEESAEK